MFAKASTLRQRNCSHRHLSVKSEALHPFYIPWISSANHNKDITPKTRLPPLSLFLHNKSYIIIIVITNISNIFQSRLYNILHYGTTVDICCCGGLVSE